MVFHEFFQIEIGVILTFIANCIACSKWITSNCKGDGFAEYGQARVNFRPCHTMRWSTCNMANAAVFCSNHFHRSFVKGYSTSSLLSMVIITPCKYLEKKTIVTWLLLLSKFLVLYQDLRLVWQSALIWLAITIIPLIWTLQLLPCKSYLISFDFWGPQILVTSDILEVCYMR